LGVATPAQDARAQMAVIDGSNLAQNIQQAAHALEQIHHQIEQIEQAAHMLAQNPLQLSPELSQSIEEARALFTNARGIAFELEELSDQIRELYPDDWANFDLEEIGARSAQWLAEDRQAIERAMRAQAQATAAIEATQVRIDRALASSQGAEGQTGAMQAGNQLLGINASQLAQIQALLVTESRALATERLERVAREERALEIQRRAFPGHSNRQYTPAGTAF
jgi:P-type conjugative transfer protein TrbJ